MSREATSHVKGEPTRRAAEEGRKKFTTEGHGRTTEKTSQRGGPQRAAEEGRKKFTTEGHGRTTEKRGMGKVLNAEDAELRGNRQ